MKTYSNSFDAITDLHNEGFANDFQLFGNDLLWLREKRVIQVGEFAILEYHKIDEAVGEFDKCIIVGIFALQYNIKGILLRRFKTFSQDLPPVLIKKIKELVIVHENKTKNEKNK